MFLNSWSGAAFLALVACLPQSVAGQGEACYTNLTLLDIDERNVTDTTVNRTYILCPETTFETGFVTVEGDIFGMPPLTLRRNMHIFCGEDGSSSNNCLITTGTFGLTSIPANFEPPVLSENVLVQGVTFSNNADFALLIGLAGSFKFIDCVFKDIVAAEGALVLEWAGGSIESENQTDDTTTNNSTTNNTTTNDTTTNDTTTNDTVAEAKSVRQQNPYEKYYRSADTKQRRPELVTRRNRNRELQISTLLLIEFIDCVFRDNQGAPNARPGLVSLAGVGIDIRWTDSLFENNDFAVPGIHDAGGYGYIIENYDDAPLTFTNTCFVNNSAVGNALVNVYGQLPTVENTYGSDNTVQYLTEIECEFTAQVDVEPPFNTLACADFDATTCAFVIDTPTDVPETTPAPQSAGTPAPQAVPTPTVPTNDIAPIEDSAPVVARPRPPAYYRPAELSAAASDMNLIPIATALILAVIAAMI